jgi:hypothetical protein
MNKPQSREKPAAALRMDGESPRVDTLTMAELQNILRGGATKPLVEEDDAALAPIPKPATDYDESPGEAK